MEKEDRSVRKEVASNGHSNGHVERRDKKEIKDKRREEEEEEDVVDDKDERDEDDILTDLISAQRPREEEEKDEGSGDEQLDNWYAPTQPYRSDDSDDERRTKKLQPAKAAQSRRSPVPKQTQYDNDDEVKLGSSVEIIPVGKNAKMSANSHSVSLQEKKPETRPVPVSTNNNNNTNRQLLNTSSNRRRSDETGETGSHQNNSESLFDDSEKTTHLSGHSPAASNGKSRVPGTPVHLASVSTKPHITISGDAF